MRHPPLVLLLLWTLFACDTSGAGDLALVHAKIYSSPTAAPLEDGSILIHAGRIRAVGRGSAIKIPRTAAVIDCKGLVVTAGFWNSHVHILLPTLLHAEQLSPQQVTSQLETMFTRWGFTTVFDIGSVLQNTILIRSRVESGEVKGPRILTVGEPFWGKGGTPVYVRGFLEANRISIPDVESREQGVERVRQQVRGGADGIKIFANSIEQQSILTMPVELAHAIVEEAHRAGKPVFAHVSNNQGIEVSVQSGVDILAHTTPGDGPWSSSLVERLAAAHVGLTPTLTLWEVEAKKANAAPSDIEAGMAVAAQQLGAFAQAGGQILFGTDIGYIDVFDTSEELVWMSRGGLNSRQILAALTTNPAERFGYSKHSGRIEKGMDADLVVLTADPAQDAMAFSKVRYTVRGGKVMYSAR